MKNAQPALDDLLHLGVAPKQLAMTPARMAALMQGWRDGGEIILGGSDETVPRRCASSVPHGASSPTRGPTG